jgi:PAS domain S-box-containing protein
MQLATTAEPLPVLVVDDDSALIRTLADILRMHGYAPETAVTGREGLAKAADRAPALAVVDLRLPDMDGMELAAKLHELSELTEVVVLTGNASVESAVAALREHSIDYLLKPVQVDKLLQVASLATERWQRRQAEEKLRESDERFRRVVESDMLGIMFWDATGAIDDANYAYLRMIGYSREDLEAGRLNFSALTPPEYAEVDAAKLEEVAERGVIEPYEKEYVRKDGSRVSILVGAATLQGQRDRGVAFVLDISDRKRAEYALEARERQQAAVAGFGQRALGAEDVPALLSDAAVLVAETLDLPFSGVLERKSDGSALVLRAGVGWQASSIGQVLVPISDDKQAGFTVSHGEAAIVADFSSEQRFARSTLLRDHGIASGATVVIPGPIHPYGVLGAHDRRPRQFTQDHVHFLQAIAHIIGTAVERQRTESAFRQAQRLEAVGRLAGGVAHDFNNMLTAITGYGEMVRMNLAAGDPQRDDVEEILKAADRAAGLTRQLLAFSRQQVLQPRLVNLNDIVGGLEKMLRRLIGEDIEFVTLLGPDLGWAKADPGQMEQVILNLCVNARDAMPEGGTLTVETANVELDLMDAREHAISEPNEPGSYVMLAVTDTGIGMDADTKARIYEPFFSTKPADKGTGLGLATVYGIVKQSGGEIYVYSEVGQGSTFKVFLPHANDMPVENHDNAARPGVAGGTETVLLAEDEESVRKLTQRVLEKAGYTVLVARNGTEAQQISKKHRGRIHLLVTDMVMPLMNGRVLAERLRARRPDMGVLYLSGYTDSTVVRQGLLDGGAHFLQKPFSNDLLARKVREALDTPSRVPTS